MIARLLSTVALRLRRPFDACEKRVGEAMRKNRQHALRRRWQPSAWVTLRTRVDHARNLGWRERCFDTLFDRSDRVRAS